MENMGTQTCPYGHLNYQWMFVPMRLVRKFYDTGFRHLRRDELAAKSYGGLFFLPNFLKYMLYEVVYYDTMIATGFLPRWAAGGMHAALRLAP